MVGPIISGISNVVSTAMQGKQSRRNIRDTIAAQKQAAELENRRNIENWERANWYNAPTQQMARLREAGLNPAMIYGSGGSKTVATNLPKYNAPRPDYSQRTPMVDPSLALGAFQDFRIKNSQIDNLNEQNKVIQAEATTKQAEAKNAWRYHWNRSWKMERDKAMASFQTTGEMLDYQLQAKKQQVEKDKVSIKMKKLEYEWMNAIKGSGIAGKAFPFLKLLFK